MKLLLVIGIGLLTTNMLFAESQTPQSHFPDISLWSRTTLGQVVSSEREKTSYDYEFEGEWLENVEGGVRLNRQVTPSILGRLNIGFVINASRVRQSNTITVEQTAKMFSAVLLDASIQYARKGLFSSFDSLTLEMGYFPFKYNPQSTNLGEYLFRTGTYPGVIISGFENSNIDKTKLAGVHCAWEYPWFKFDAILNTELDMYPLHDINATMIATGSLPKIFTFGLGVQFAHLISMDMNKTTPGLDTAHYKNLKTAPSVAYIRKKDNDTTYDTTLYTFRGTKLMSRATLDIKGIIEKFTGELSFFGKEDLKLYGEAAILGVKDYPGWYDNIGERIPVMAGFNIPAFKILDVLSIEVEYYSSPYWNSQEHIWKDASPVPYTGSGDMNYNNWNDSLAKKDDDIKWSIYASKKFGSWLRLSGQIACDHTPRNWYTAAPPSYVKYTEMVPRTEDWYFMMRASFYF